MALHQVNGHNSPEDLEDLVNLRVTREEGLSCAHLGKDATDGPHVDASRVLTSTQENLGGSVPQGDDLVGVCAQRNTKGAGKTEIGELEVALLVDEEVLGLEIAVQDAVGVAVLDAIAKLEHELADDLIAKAELHQMRRRALGQGLASTTIAHRKSLHVLLEVEVEELEDEV